MQTVVPSLDLKCWNGTTYGYETCKVQPWKPECQSFGGEEVEKAIVRSQDYLLSLQDREDGFWVGEVEANSTLTSEYIYFMHFMGTLDELRQRKMVHYLKETQLADGSWNIHYEGPGDLSTTLEAYCAMKLAGEDVNGRSMARARDFITAHGGVENARVFTKIFLALLGVRPWERCPALPPELMLLPKGFPMNIYEMSSWARATVVPLLILWHYKPSLRTDFNLLELETPGCPAAKAPERSSNGKGWDNFFFAADRLLKAYEKRRFPWMRRKALRLAEEWILDRQDPTGEWGGIMPAMMNSLMALKCLGYPQDHPAVRKGLEAVHRFAIEDARSLRLQSCVSPVWDTANTSLALLESRLAPDHPALRKAIAWLWSKQTREKGDWAVKNPDAIPGGWSFEFANEFYPDCDDTLAVMTVLRLSGADAEHPEAWYRGLQWLLSMQSRNGGWGAFDIDNQQEIWNRIPFADHKSMLDPPTADLSGRVLEFLGGLGYGVDFAPVRRAVAFIESEQEADGSWYGRWGVNYLYGTWCVLSGLGAVGYDMQSSRIRRAVAWLKTCQKEDGGWGEPCASYDDPSKKDKGKSTPSQTSWALMALIAAGEARSEAVRQGVGYLLRMQNPKGSWDEKEFTGTGFPRFFYLRYHMYRDYFPLLALARYEKALNDPNRTVKEPGGTGQHN
jgi:squalene-hopene/tetraprenyl-beta-curcumene cyclase